MTVEQIEKGAAAVHPATLYVLAQRLYEGGKRDEAVFWYYVGQLRFRFYLSANPQLNESEDAKLFGKLAEVVGIPIDEYAFQDIPKLLKTLERVKEWDEKNPNGFTSKETNHAVWLEVREGFRGFISEVEQIGAASKSSAPSDKGAGKER